MLLMYAWLEVDLDVIAHNYRIIREHLGSTKIMGVVKADAYGHGIEPVARTLDGLGIDAFAVISFEEARRVRKVSDRDVLLLGFLNSAEIEAAIKDGMILSLFDRELADKLNETAQKVGKKARVHLKVETGLNRLGMSAEELIDLLDNLENYPNLQIESIYTHLTSSGNRERDQAQFDRFKPVLDEIKARGIQIQQHMTNSHALQVFPEGYMDMMRLGLALYGVEEVLPGLKPSLQAKTVVIQKKKVKAGEGISYNHLFVAEKDMEIAVIAMGYAEGLSQTLTGKVSVLAGGEVRPIVGQICMNLSVIDATGLDLKRGDEVVVIGRQGNQEIRVADMAKAGGIRHHEILIRMGKGLPKVYFESGLALIDSTILVPESETANSSAAHFIRLSP
jgi:alanine racemase